MFAGEAREEAYVGVIDLDSRLLAVRLGLGDLVRPKACHGYQNACRCKECLDRARGPKRVERPRQPWEAAA